MSVVNFLESIRKKNIELWFEGGNLHYTVKRKDLEYSEVDAMVQEIKRYKSEIIGYIKTHDHIVKEGPLSYNQQALWFLYQMNPESLSYNISFSIRIRSKLDDDALQKSVQDVINRHPSLRTTFSIQENGQPRQCVAAYKKAWFEHIDIAGLHKDAFDRRMKQDLDRPFDLIHGPVVRTRLYSRSDCDHVFVMTTHHIVNDGWSFWKIIEELITLYSAHIRGHMPNLPKILHSYSDYVDEQKHLIAGPIGNKLWEYWKYQLFGDVSVLHLPLDKPRPSVLSDHGATYRFSFDKTFTRELRIFAKHEKVTLNSLLVAALHILLHRYTNQQVILVGMPTTGRVNMKYRNTVGYFVNPVVLKGNFSNNPSLRTFLHHMQDTVLEALANQEYPFPLLIKHLHPQRELSVSPVFQVMYVYHQPFLSKSLRELVVEKAPDDTPGPDLDVEIFDIPQEEGQFDLTLWVIDEQRSLTCELKYNTDLFYEETVQRMAVHFQNVLESIMTQPEENTRTVPFLPEAEKTRILCTWNDTTSAYPSERCIHHLIEDRTSVFPMHVAAECNGETITYLELNGRANQLARYLRSLGGASKALVGICIERSIDMLIALLAIMKSGGAYVPLDIIYPKERIRYMLEDSGASIVLTHSALKDALPVSHIRPVYLDSDWPEISALDKDNLPLQMNSDDAAYVIYTSGSTGKPKGVEISHRSVVNFLTSMAVSPGMTKEDVMVAVTTISFDIAVMELYLPLVIGAKTVIADRETATDGDLLCNLLEKTGATVMQATPATWTMLLSSGLNHYRLKKSLCGGEALTKKLALELLDVSGEVWNMYGPTETTVWSTLYKVTPCDIQNRDSNAPVPIGRPINNTQLYILDASYNPVPIGAPGNLYIGGHGLAAGYFRRPGLTGEKFVKNPLFPGTESKIYQTGDIVRYLPDGNVEYISRADHQIKIRGFRVESGEVEAAILKHPNVSQAVVLARDIGKGNKKLIAYIKPAGPTPGTRELRNSLKADLPEYMIPSFFVVMEDYPLTPNGKLDRGALPLPSQGITLALETEFVFPRTAIEAHIADVWKEVLHLDRVGIYDNFFDVGGDSLLLVRILNTLKKIISKEVRAIDLIQYPTIHSLADYLSKDPASGLSDACGKKRAALRVNRRKMNVLRRTG